MEGSEAIRPDKDGPVIVQEAWENLGIYTGVEKREGTYWVRTERGGAVVEFVTDDMLRIKYFLGNDPEMSTTVAIDPAAAAGGEVQAQLEETEGGVRFRTASLEVTLDKLGLSMTVRDLAGTVLAEQKSITFSPDGSAFGVYDMPQDSHFYGLGEKSSFLDKRGERYTNWNTDVYAPHMPEIEALYESIPLLIHMHGGISCGLFLDNPGRSDFDMRSHGVAFTVSCTTGSYDLYFINGPELKDVVKRYTTLTGRINLPPKWAIGYHQSRYSYMNQQEVLELGRTFRAKQIPCDVIYLDIHYMDEYRVFTFDPVRFPDPAGMIRELREMGIRIVPIVDPGVKKDAKYPIYQEGIREDHFCRKLEGDLFFGEVWPGTSAFPDFTDDRTAKWWADQHAFYTELGIEGIWNDMNEPAVFNESKTMDLDVMHRNNGKPLTHEELHNIYGLLMSKSTFEGLKEQLDRRRPFVLTRAGYAGIQRYAAVWTGDNRSFWEHMAMAMPMVLNMGLSGLAFAGPDIGGFAHHTSAELLIRWTQMGVFFPYCRNHSALETVRQEPWSFGAEAEAILREYIGLRYRWMPQLYNLFHEAAATGLPVIRPLILEYPNDPNVTNLCDQFLLGDNVLIAPVYRPDTDHRAVYLPEGSWLDYWTGEAHEGGRYILAHSPLSVMPIYVKTGSVIAEGPLKQHAEDGADDAVTFHVYGADAEGDFAASYRLYEDDGVSYGYEVGAYSELELKVRAEQGRLVLSYAYPHRQYEANRETLRFVLRRPKFRTAEVEGLGQVTLEQMEQGALGWAVGGQSGDLIIQAQDRPEGGQWAVISA